jgi:hypothetical protein
MVDSRFSEGFRTLKSSPSSANRTTKQSTLFPPIEITSPSISSADFKLLARSDSLPTIDLALLAASSSCWWDALLFRFFAQNGPLRIGTSLGKSTGATGQSRDRAANKVVNLGMPIAKVLILAAAIAAAVSAGQQLQATVTVTEFPPEKIPAGSCTESDSGYLGIVEKDKTERTKLTDQEIGQYVRKKLAEGYSVELYPQASGKTFTIQTCHSEKR